MQVGLCLEQTLGHRAHSMNLQAALASRANSIDIVHVEFGEAGCVPWAIRGSWQAAMKLRAKPAHDVRFFHTQSVSLFAPLLVRGRPYVVSVDATPRQIDTMGAWYTHKSGTRPVEQLKARWYRAVFARAAAVVAWSEWAADSLVEDYGVARSKIAVIHPGAPRPFFELNREPTGAAVTVLFVGGDLRRKGGDLLLRSLERLGDRVKLLIVTTEPVPEAPNVEVIADATPGSDQLVGAYRRADIFCLPTRGDCTPVVLGEAMAAGLPVIATRIGSNAETVRDGVDGVLIAPDSLDELGAALSRLVDQPTLRRQMGGSARTRALHRFDAERNALRLMSLLESVAQ
jgi:glycosyltransferase involved in cell wall biosynthesis